MNDSVRIGVIGAGIMGERHCRVCANLPRVTLVGIADLDTKRGSMIAERYATTYFPNHRDLLPELDAVTIAASTPAHYVLAAECLEQGVHVLVEKPITETVAQAEQLVQLAEAKELVLQVGHIERFNPAFVELKHVTEGLRLISVNMHRLSPFDTSNTDVDVVRDLMIHDLDLALGLVGAAPETLQAWGRTLHTKAIDHAVAHLSYTDGPIVMAFASRITEQKVRKIEVIAEGAYIEADLLNKSVLVHRRTLPEYLNGHNTTKYRQESIIERIHVPMYEPLMLELKHFTDCVREGTPPQVSGIDGLHALALAEQVAEQIVDGRK
ncbi:MAG: Gfo/Idh/MocA family oxidoreductase [Anaerolineae bacterium]|nr:Gfo/Idh/MocA family oxidoreductase [Anaerolineae bacterium]